MRTRVTMKMEEVPKEAWDAAPTPIPTKQIPDWDAMFVILKEKGFVIIDDPDTHLNPYGSMISPKVKALATKAWHARQKLLTRRLTPTRWVCVLPLP